MSVAPVVKNDSVWLPIATLPAAVSVDEPLLIKISVVAFVPIVSFPVVVAAPFMVSPPVPVPSPIVDDAFERKPERSGFELKTARPPAPVSSERSALSSAEFVKARESPSEDVATHVAPLPFVWRIMPFVPALPVRSKSEP